MIFFHFHSLSFTYIHFHSLSFTSDLEPALHRMGAALSGRMQGHIWHSCEDAPSRDEWSAATMLGAPHGTVANKRLSSLRVELPQLAVKAQKRVQPSISGVQLPMPMPSRYRSRCLAAVVTDAQQLMQSRHSCRCSRRCLYPAAAAKV